MGKVGIVYYSMYGHIKTLADEIKAGVEAAGCEATLLQVAETLPQEVLDAMKAPAKDTSIPLADRNELEQYDGLLFGIPTRFGMASAQMKAFLDSTGGLWAAQKLAGKPAGMFVSTGTQGGGQETTALTFISQLTHHGMIYVPMGYSNPKMLDMSEIHGGSPYGPGTFAGGDGSRQPTDTEKEIAKSYGENFAKVVLALIKGRAA